MVLLVGVLILVICMTALYMAFKYCSGRLSYDNGDSGDLDEQSLLIAQSIDVETQRQTDSYYQSQD